MQLPAERVGVDVVGGILLVGRKVLPAVGVVRDVHFLLADQLPVIPVQLAPEHEGLVVILLPGVDVVGCVIANRRSFANAPLTGEVLPRRSPTVQGLINQQRLSGLERGLRLHVPQMHEGAFKISMPRCLWIVVGPLHLVVTPGRNHQLPIGGAGVVQVSRRSGRARK
ncbi:hypothetical protein D9M71_696690 [compost metagenome]